MFIIKNTETGRTHSEPSRQGWRSDEYKSIAAAKAGITRTIKYYQKAIDSVNEALSNGDKPYVSPMYLSLIHI